MISYSIYTNSPLAMHRFCANLSTHIDSFLVLGVLDLLGCGREIVCLVAMCWKASRPPDPGMNHLVGTVV